MKSWINPAWARPMAGVCWLFAAIGFVQWLNGGEYIEGEWMALPNAGKAALALVVVGVVLWMTSHKLREVAPPEPRETYKDYGID